MDTSTQSMRARYKNWEVAAFALFALGGGEKFVHTEDVALKCFELAPSSFSWVRHAHLPDKDIVRVALTDARKEKAGGLVVGRSGRGYRVASSGAYGSTADGWRLTEAGVKWCLENATRFTSPASVPNANVHRQETIHKLLRVRGHALFRDFQRSPSEVPFTLGSLADLFRCRVDSPPLVWRRRLDNYRNLAQIATQEDSLARHPALRRYLGAPPEFPGQEQPHFRVLLAEIVADAVCSRLISRAADTKPDEYADYDWDAYYADYSKYMSEFLPIAHATQLKDSDARAN